jgi:hypothetical protein
MRARSNLGRRKQADRVAEQAQQRVEAVWSCIATLRPDLTPRAKEHLAKQVLGLCECFEGGIELAHHPQITPAQITRMVWSNSQCIQRSCPMVLFSDQLAAELNAFYCGREAEIS